MASEYTLDVLVNPISNSSAASAMGARDAQLYAQAFQQNFSKSQPLGRITGQVTEFQKSMEAANARVIAFGASAGSIYFVKTAFDKLISSTIQVEKGLANINAILNLGQSALKSFSAEMFRAASQTGQTFETASQVALEFARHGVSATETVKRMTSAMELMRISGLSAADSVNSITAAINAFGKEGLTSEDIVNRLTAVDTRFAVSAQDLAKAIQRVGSTAEDAGIRFNQLLGFVTAAQTATARGGAVIGNAFKSIFTRLGRPQVLDDLESIGVTTRTATGQILPMVTILRNLASEYDSLSSSQKSFITQAVGGVYQVNILKASLADLGNGMSIFDKASLAAANSAGLIDKRMESLNETMASKLNVSALKVTELFSNFGNLAFNDSAKKGIDTINNSLEFLIDKLQDIKPNDSVGEKIGKTLGQGIAKGVGDILSGPGIQVVTALAFKALSTLGKFTVQSGGEFLGRNNQTEKLKFIQQDITNFIRQSADAQEIVNSKFNVAVRLSEAYARNLAAANASSVQFEAFTSAAAKKAAPNIAAVPRVAGGYVPAFFANQEESQARALGAAAGVRAQWGQGTIGGQRFIMNNKEVEIPSFGANGDSAVIPTYPKGYVPNFAHVPIISKLVGKFLTNTIYPYGYQMSSKIDDLKSLNLKDIFNALILDKPSSGVLQKRAYNIMPEATDVRDFAFRKMFGLKPRHDVSDLITENQNQTYSFNKDTLLRKGIGESINSVWNHKRNFVAEGHDVMGNFGVQRTDNGYHYKDIWDFGLNNGESVDYKGIFNLLKNPRKIFSTIKKQESLFGSDRALSRSPLSNLLRNVVGSITSPITFEGDISRHELDYAKGHIPNFALDHVFSLVPDKKVSRGIQATGVGRLHALGARYEQNIIDRLPDFGFTNIKHLSAINHNERADVYARYMGSPWLLDAKHTTGEMAKQNELSYKEGSMRRLWDILRNSPDRLHNLDPELSPESLMKFGIILSSVPNRPTLRGYEKAGIGYKNLSPYSASGGFVPNFVSDNAKAAMERMAAYSGGDETLVNQANLAKEKLKQAHSLSDNDKSFLLTNKDNIINSLGKGLGQSFTIDALQMGDIKYAMTGNNMSPELAQMLSKIVRKPNGRQALMNLLRGNAFAGGFIPNFSALGDAIQREMGAGYSSSQIRIGKDSSLISSFNPNGMGVYNSTEGSLSRGIGLAEGAGINPVTKGMAKGFIPNFADASISLVLGMLQGSVTDLSSRLRLLAFGYDAQIEKTRAVAEEYTKAVQAFQSGERTFKSKTFGTVSNAAELESKVSRSNYAFLLNPDLAHGKNEEYSQYNNKLLQREQLISNVAYKGLFGAPLIGETAGAAAKNLGYERAGKALEDFSGGLTSSFQILSQFPNQLGVALAAGEMLNTFSKSISNVVTKVATYEKILDRQNTNLEKMSSAANSTLDSFTRLNEIYSDGISTIQDLELQQRKLDKALIDLTSVPGGGKLAEQLRTSTTDDQRRNAVARALDFQSNERDITSSKLSISQADASRRAFGFPLSNNVFQYTNENDKLNKQQLLRSSVATIQNSAIGNINDRDLIGRLQSLTLTGGDINKIKGEAANANVLGLDKNSLKVALDELVAQLSNFQIPENFKGGIEDWKKYQADINAIHVQELALKNQYNQELQNLLGKGGIISSFNLKSAGLGEESSYRAQQFGLVQAQNQIKLNALTTNDYGLIGQNASQKQAQIIAASQHEQTQNTIKGAEVINTELSKLFDKVISNQKQGASGFTNEPSELQKNMAAFIASRQNILTSNPQNLINAVSNPENLIKNILGTREEAANQGVYSQSYETLATELSTLSKTPDFYNKVIDILSSNKNIAEKSKEELVELHADTITALKEASFKELANILGGSDLLKHGSAREKARELRKDEYILQRSNNPLARGEAAHDILANFIPESKRDLNNPDIKQLYNAIQAGQQYGNQLVYGGTKTGGLFSTQEANAISYAQTYGDKNTKALQTPSGTPQVGGGINVTGLDKSVQDASNALERFKSALDNIGGSQAAYNAQLKDYQKSEQDFINNIKQKYFTPGISGTNNEGNISQQNILSRNSGLITGAGSAALTGAALYAFRNQAKQVAPAVKGVGEYFGFGNKPIAQLKNSELEQVYKSKIAGESWEQAINRQRNIENIQATRIRVPIKPPTLSELAEKNWQTPWKSLAPEATEASVLAKYGGGTLKYGGRALGTAAIGLGAYNAYSNIRSGDYLGATKGILQTGLGFAGPVGKLASLASQPLDIGLTTLNNRVDTALSETGRGKGLDMQLANINRYKTLIDPTYGGTYQAEYRDYVNKKTLSPDQAEFIKRFEKLTGSVNSVKHDYEIVAPTVQQNNQPNNGIPITEQNIKIEDGTLTVFLDLSKAQQQVKTMISAALTDLIKNNPPKVNSAAV